MSKLDAIQLEKLNCLEDYLLDIRWKIGLSLLEVTWLREGGYGISQEGIL